MLGWHANCLCERVGAAGSAAPSRSGEIPQPHSGRPTSASTVVDASWRRNRGYENRTLRYLAVAALVAAFASVGTPARAQTYTGRIDITIEDSTGGRLPGVSVELTGQMIQSAVSDAKGEVHFLNLNVGNYQVKASLTGFNDWKNTKSPWLAASRSR